MSQHCSKHRLSTYVDRCPDEEKLINSPSGFGDTTVRTTFACCEKPDRNSDSQVTSHLVERQKYINIGQIRFTTVKNKHIRD
ncbi:hypothetical protein T08_3953 [Trichinella sp. T8]|nr:hypothetical protein T08_3953 [Trichinella sp. T8]